MARNQLSAPSRELPPAREGGSVVLQIRPPEEDRIIDLSRFFSLLYRERWLILAVALLTAALAGTVLTQMAPQYSSSVLLKAESGAAKGSGLEALLPALSGEDAGLRSEIDVMRSRTIVGRVVDRLGLVEDPEFNPVLDDPNQGALARIWDKAYSTAMGFIRGGGPPPTEEGIRYMTVDSTVRNLSVSNDAGSLSILVSFHSSDPSKSARIANTLVDEYLAYRSAEKLNLARSATGWLGESLNQLREQVRDAEQKVQAFRAENNLVDTESGSVLVQRMSEMNAQLVQLRAERQTAEAKLQSARDAMSNGGAVAEMLDSPVIQRLRDQEGELSRQLTEQSQLGRRHPVIIELRSRLAAVQNDIQAEMRRIVSGLSSNVVAFKAREVSLERAYNSLSEEIGGQGQARAQLDQLQSEARTLRATFEQTLAQYKAIDNPDRLSAPDLSVVSAAAAPIFPSFPQKVPMLAGAAILGILLGAVAAILRDLILTTPPNVVESGWLAALPELLKAACDSMTQLNAVGCGPMVECGAHAATDVTGFGLFGHLVEMMGASRSDIRLDASAVPALDGAAEMLEAGVRSTLHPGNAAAAPHANGAVPDLLFDPQTAGGLLAGVPADRAEACVAALRSLGYDHAAVIGAVESAAGSEPRIILGNLPPRPSLPNREFRR